MIKINNREYNNWNSKITWGTFTVSSYGKKRTGNAPFITFNLENKIFIGLEFTFSDKMFKETKLEVRTNIKNYISDIVYEDERGWISINDEEYDCIITKINEKDFRIEFSLMSTEININIDTNVELFQSPP